MNTLPVTARRTATIGYRAEWAFPAVRVIVDGDRPGTADLACTLRDDVTDVHVRFDDAPDADAAVWMPAARVVAVLA